MNATNVTEQLNEMMGTSALTYFFITLLCITACWWALQSFRFELFLKDSKPVQGKMLQVFLSVVIGYELAQFILDYAHWSSMLRWLF